jgi:hypothetical protein
MNVTASKVTVFGVTPLRQRPNALDQKFELSIPVLAPAEQTHSANLGAALRTNHAAARELEETDTT